MMHPSTTGLLQPIEDALEKPYSMPPNATVESAMDGTSRCGRFPSPTLSSKNTAQASEARANGTMQPRHARHPYASMMAPPTTGPIAGPADITMPAMPMAVPRFSTGNTSMGTTDTNGSSTPDAAACSTRPQISRKNVGAAAQSAVPAANAPVAAKNS